MAVIWTVNDYFYIAGSLNAENLAGNIFTNFSLLSLTELPSVFIGQFLMGLSFVTVDNQAKPVLLTRSFRATVGALRVHGAGHGAADALHLVCILP